MHDCRRGDLPQSLQSAQEFPAVRQGHEAYLEAQKKYVATLQSASGFLPLARRIRLLTL